MDSVFNILSRQYLPEENISERHLWLGSHLNSLKSGKMLDRSDFNPLRFRKDILPFLMSWEPVKDGDRFTDFRFKVFSQGLVDPIGMDMTNKLVSDLPITVCQDYMFQLGALCAEQARPVYSRTKLEFHNGLFLHSEKTFYPFNRKDETCVLVLFTVISQSLEITSLIEAGEPALAYDSYFLLEDIDNWQDAKRAA